MKNDGYDDLRKTKDELRETKNKLEKTRQKLNGHLYYTYGISWAVLMFIVAVLHGLAGWFMFFHKGMVVFVIWVIIFVVIVWFYFFGLHEIKKSLEV